MKNSTKMLIRNYIKTVKHINTPKLFIYLFIYLKSSKTHTSAAPLLLEKGAEVKMKLQDLKLLIDKKKKKNIKSLLV